MTKDELVGLAKRIGIDELILEYALVGAYGVPLDMIRLPQSERAVALRRPKTGDRYLSYYFGVETALEGEVTNSCGPRLILEPSVLEVEVVSFEPVVEGGRHAWRSAQRGEYYRADDVFQEWSWRAPSSHQYLIYRRTATKKVVPIE